RAELHTGGDVYEQGLRLLASQGFDARRERIKTIVVITVEQAVALVSPAYDGGASGGEGAARGGAHDDALAKRRHTPRWPCASSSPAGQERSGDGLCRSSSRAAMRSSAWRALRSGRSGCSVRERPR